MRRLVVVAITLLVMMSAATSQADAAFWNSSRTRTYSWTNASGQTVYYHRIESRSPRFLERLWELEQRKNRWLMATFLRR